MAENRDEAAQTARSFLALRLLLTTFSVLCALGWLTLPISDVRTRLIGLAAVFSMTCASLGSMAIDICTGYERPRVAAQAQLAGGLILTALSVIVLMLGWGLTGFVAAYVIGALVQAVLLIGAVRRQLFFPRPEWKWNRMRALLREARPFALLTLLHPITHAEAIDLIVLGFISSPVVVGSYAAAKGLISRLIMVPEGIITAMYPAVANGYRQNREDVERMVWRYVVNLLLVTAPLALCLCFSAPTVLRLLFGEQYLLGDNALRIAAWFLPLWGLNHIMRQCLTAIRQQNAVLRLTLLSGLVLCGLYAVLIPVFGITGAAAASVLREGLMLGLWLRLFSHHFGAPRLLRELGRLVCALGIMTLPFSLLLICQDAAITITAAALACACYIQALLMLKLADPVPCFTAIRTRLGG
jgi:O-antigen/teichoic acid export membrane protein